MSTIKDSQIDLSLPMNETDVFHFDDSRPSFNDLAKQNGMTYWFASELAEMLGYSSMATFTKAVQRALAACTTLGIDILENFQQVERVVDGVKIKDYKISRFACYLAAMNADSTKPEVARAQAYFAVIAETFKRYIDEADDVERVLVREEVSQHEKALGAVAKKAGVTDFPYFQSAGYRGLYNMSLSQLKKYKGIPDASRSLLDFMGKEELAANLFRVTQTEAKLRNEGIKGQHAAEAAAESVGKKVRQTMIDISGSRPEELPLARDIKQVKSDIKASKKEFERLDKPTKSKRLPQTEN